MQTMSTKTGAQRQVGDMNLDLKQISSPVLARLVEEVRQERGGGTTAYNRTHNRHNRGR